MGFTPPVTIVDGIDTVEVPDFDLDALGHSYIAQAAGVFHDMFDLLRYNAAPDDRQRLVQQMAPDGGVFWQVML